MLATARYWNYSEIALAGMVSKAFYLMVEGGTHTTSGITVPALDPNDFDRSITMGAKIFHSAYSSCLTYPSTFQAARECTLMFAADSNQTESISKAWDAVGVLEGNYTTLYNRVSHSISSLSSDDDLFHFVLNETVKAGQSVTCTLQNEGDYSVQGQLFVRYGTYSYDDYGYDGCESFWNDPGRWRFPYVKCVTEPATVNSKLYVTASMSWAYQSMPWSYTTFLVCIINNSTEPATPKPSYVINCHTLGQNCTRKSECCPIYNQNKNIVVCDGATPSTKQCKTCKGLQKSCTRTSQCCPGSSCKNKKCSK
jgi:Thermolysin metallopeptidase, alpha-helical domain/Dickkopf N-terminal cysteine-rich region